VSEHTRRAYASRVAGYLRWLTDTDLVDERAVGDPTGADPLSDAWARDFAARDYRVWLLTVAKKAPNTVNAHLTAVDAFYTHRGLGPANAGRVDLPQQAPRALEEAELRRVLRGAERLPSVRDRTIVRTLFYAWCSFERRRQPWYPLGGWQAGTKASQPRRGHLVASGNTWLCDRLWSIWSSGEAHHAVPPAIRRACIGSVTAGRDHCHRPAGVPTEPLTASGSGHPGRGLRA
jgi:hypothetical protein